MQSWLKRLLEAQVSANADETSMLKSPHSIKFERFCMVVHGVNIVIEVGQAVSAGVRWSVKYSKGVQLGLEGEFQNNQLKIGTRINQ